jgi:hypothetical protein
MQARSALTTEKVAALKLTVWYGTMPESNGKTNWTAILHNGDVSRGITLAMSEYEDRVRYEADRMRWMIGELDKEPFLLDYDADKHSGYVSPHPSPRALLLNLLARIHRDGGQYVEAHGVEKATHDAEMEVARLHSIIHSPESDDFLKGVSIEAEYQRQLHGVDDTDARYDWHQWFWVVGYLAGKALAACKSGEGDGAKARHHLVTTAALLHNWHNTLTGKPAASVHSNRGKGVADAYLPDSPNEVDRLFPLVDAQTLEKKPR